MLGQRGFKLFLFSGGELSQRATKRLQRDKEQEKEGEEEITMSLDVLNPVVHMTILTIRE